VLNTGGTARPPDEPRWKPVGEAVLAMGPALRAVEERTASGVRCHPAGGGGARFAGCPGAGTTAGQYDPMGERWTSKTGAIGGTGRDLLAGPGDVLAVRSQDGPWERDRMAPKPFSL
jgi:hypothetical protein